MKNMTLGESDIRQIVHNWGEFGVFESELSDTKCIYITFFWGVDFQLQNSTVLNLLLLRVKMETKLMVNLFVLGPTAFSGGESTGVNRLWK